MYFYSIISKSFSMINMLRIHKLNTTEFILFSKQNAMLVFADRLFKSVSNHGDLKKTCFKKLFQNY
jgi:hypothetical protein